MHLKDHCINDQHVSNTVISMTDTFPIILMTNTFQTIISMTNMSDRPIYQRPIHLKDVLTNISNPLYQQSLCLQLRYINGQ